MSNVPAIKVGDEYLTNNSGTVVVVEYINATNIRVRFSDGTETTCHSAALKGGRVRNPMQPILGSFGFVGVGKYKPSVHKNCYKVWCSMLDRCYKKSVLEKHPSYNGCTVSEEWHNFQNFAEFYYSYPRLEGWQLDKDILFSGNKIYSKDTCCFVPACLNVLVSHNKSSVSGYTGVYFEESSGKYIAACTTAYKKKRKLGRFSTATEAAAAYKKHKEAYVRETAEIWKDKLPLKVYEALINWKLPEMDNA